MSSSRLISVTYFTKPYSDACAARSESDASFLRTTATLEPCVPSDAAPCFCVKSKHWSPLTSD